MFRSFVRLMSSNGQNIMNEGEKLLFTKLTDKFQPNRLKVVDISGGCGSMYEIEIESQAFKGLTTVQQQRLVNQTLQNEISKMHGLRLTTSAPKN
jgi:stress-induced morphogen